MSSFLRLTNNLHYNYAYKYTYASSSPSNVDICSLLIKLANLANNQNILVIAQDSFHIRFRRGNRMKIEFFYQDAQNIIGQEFRQGRSNINVANSQSQQG